MRLGNLKFLIKIDFFKKMEEKFMKEQLWTQTILDSYNNINTILKTIDKRVLSLGINSYKTTNYGQDSTLELMEAVIDLIERK